MTPEDLVVQIRKSIIEENITIFKDLFASTEVRSASDPYWIRALSLYASLTTEDRRVLLDIVRQVMVDTVSNIFAVLDGVSVLEGQETEFRLLAGSGTEPLNGELQDRFLELEERHGKGGHGKGNITDCGRGGKG